MDRLQLLPPWVRSYLEGILKDPLIKRSREELAPLRVCLDDEVVPLGEAGIAEALVGSRSTMLMGPAGSGKTLLLRSLLHDYALYALGEGDLARCTLCEEMRLPLYLDLKSLRPGETLEDILRRWLFEHTSGDSPYILSEALSSAMDLLILIDHLDLLGGVQELDHLTGVLGFLQDKYPQHSLLVALRDHDQPLFAPWLSFPSSLHLRPLDQSSALRYLRHQHGAVKAHALGQVLMRERLWDLAQTPQTLDHLARLAQDEEVATLNRAQVLEKLLQRMLAPWETSLWSALGEIALAMRHQGVTDWERPAFLQQIEGLGLGQPTRAVCDSLVGCGLLRWTFGRKGLAFAQRLYQDFFAAIALEGYLERGEALLPLLGERPEAWGEELLLLYGRTQKRETLIHQLLSPEERYDCILLAARCLAMEPDRMARKGQGHLGPGTHYLLGKAFAELGFLEEAEAEFEEALHYWPNQARLQERLARIYALLGRYAASLRTYEKMEESAPEELAWPIARAMTRARMGAPEEARRELEELVRILREGEAEAEHQRADLEAEGGSLEEALLHARQAVELAPKTRHICQFAHLLYCSGRKEEAMQRLEEASLQDPGYAEAAVTLGAIQEQEGALSEALASYQKALELTPGEASYHLALGRLHRLLGEPLLARLHLEEAIRIRPRYAAAEAELGRVLEGEEDYLEALDCFRAAVDDDPKVAEYHHLLGWSLRRLGRLQQAEAELRTAIALEPKDPEAQNRLGVVLSEQGRDAEALLLYQYACQLSPHNPLYHQNLGAARQSLGAEVSAKEAFAEAIRLCHEAASNGTQEPLLLTFIEAEAHNEMGKLLEKGGDYEEALAEYQRAAELMPNELNYRLREGMAYGRSQQLEHMLKVLQRAAEMRPDDAETHHQLGQAYESLGRTQEALEEYQRAARLEPGDGALLKRLGRLQRAMGLTVDSLATLERAAHLFPQDGEAHYEWALSLEETGEVEKALEEYRKGARLQVENPVFWLAIARCARCLGKLSEAQIALRTVLSLEPSSAAARSELSRILEAQGRYQEALQENLAALKLEPEGAWHHYRTSSLYLGLARPQEAVLYLKKALELEPQHAGWHHELGRLLEGFGEGEEALKEYRRAVELDPTQPASFLDLARLEQGMGRGREAVRHLEHALQWVVRGEEIHLRLAAALLGAGEKQRALQECQEALKLNPDHAGYLDIAAKALGELGHFAEAASYRRRADEENREKLPNAPPGDGNHKGEM